MVEHKTQDTSLSRAQSSRFSGKEMPQRKEVSVLTGGREQSFFRKKG
jgi:hypothetical protein